MKIIFLVLIMATAFSSLAPGQDNPGVEEGIRDIFPALQTLTEESRVFQGQEVKVYAISAAGALIGWAVLLDERGKAEPITFLVGVDTQGKVTGVQVLKYREMFGSEIKHRSFLRQFQGKSKADKISIGSDIDAVTSATISSQAAASAVRKAISIIEEGK